MSSTNHGKHSVLYVAENDVFTIGPFDTKAEADAAAVAATKSGEFDVSYQNVYLLTPDHELIPYTMAELFGDDDDDAKPAND